MIIYIVSAINNGRNMKRKINRDLEKVKISFS